MLKQDVIAINISTQFFPQFSSLFFLFVTYDIFEINFSSVILMVCHKMSNIDVSHRELLTYFFCNGTMICLHIPRGISQFIIKHRVNFFYFSFTTPVMNYDSKKKGFKLNWFWHVIGAFTSISPNFQLNKPKKTLIFHGSLTALINRAPFDRDLVLRFFL